MLPFEDSLNRYIRFLTTVSSCDIGDYFRKQVLDAYFLKAVSTDMFNNVEDLELVDSKVNLLISDDYDDFYAVRQIGTEEERE